MISWNTSSNRRPVEGQRNIEARGHYHDPSVSSTDLGVFVAPSTATPASNDDSEPVLLDQSVWERFEQFLSTKNIKNPSSLDLYIENLNEAVWKQFGLTGPQASIQEFWEHQWPQSICDLLSVLEHIRQHTTIDAVSITDRVFPTLHPLIHRSFWEGRPVEHGLWRLASALEYVTTLYSHDVNLSACSQDGMQGTQCSTLDSDRRVLRHAYRLKVFNDRYRQLCEERTEFYWERLDDAYWILHENKVDAAAKDLTSTHVHVLRNINEKGIRNRSESLISSFKTSRVLSERVREAMIASPTTHYQYCRLIEIFLKLRNYFGLVAVLVGMIDAFPFIDKTFSEAIATYVSPYSYFLQTVIGRNFSILVAGEEPSLPHFSPYCDNYGCIEPSIEECRQALAKIALYPVEQLDSLLEATQTSEKRGQKGGWVNMFRRMVKQIPSRLARTRQ